MPRLGERKAALVYFVRVESHRADLGELPGSIELGRDFPARARPLGSHAATAVHALMTAATVVGLSERLTTVAAVLESAIPPDDEETPANNDDET